MGLKLEELLEGMGWDGMGWDEMDDSLHRDGDSLLIYLGIGAVGLYGDLLLWQYRLFFLIPFDL